MIDAQWLPRIRQAVVVTTDLPALLARLRHHLSRWTAVPEPYRDPGVDRFGVENAVLAVGDSFLEILAPVRPDTAAGRHLQRRGGDSGYMVMLQVSEMAATRRRLADLSVRVVWQTERADAVDLHLHPHDVPGALVAVDTMDPPHSWRWGGPAFTGSAADAVHTADGAGGLVGLTLGVPDPAAAARRWAAVVGAPEPAGPSINLAGGRQRIDFVAQSDAGPGLLAIRLALPGLAERADDLTVGSTSIEIHPLAASAAGEETVHG
jgi:glyoxalase-like protein